MFNSLVINGESHLYHSRIPKAKFRRTLRPFVLDLNAVQVAADSVVVGSARIADGVANPSGNDKIVDDVRRVAGNWRPV